jgi:hypothetical protein
MPIYTSYVINLLQRTQFNANDNNNMKYTIILLFANPLLYFDPE